MDEKTNHTSRTVTVYGRDGCPFTRAARESLEAEGREVAYVNVRKDLAGLEKMLSLSGGSRRIPFIVDGDRVQTGWQGKT
jgi:glutaredoxin 3